MWIKLGECICSFGITSPGILYLHNVFWKAFHVPRGNIWSMIPGVSSSFMINNAILRWQVWIHYRYTLLSVSHLEIYIIRWSLSFLVPEPDQTKPSDSGRHQIDQTTRLPSITSGLINPVQMRQQRIGQALNLKRSQSLLRPQGKWWPCPSTKKARPLSVCMCSVGPNPSKVRHWPWRCMDAKDGKEISCTRVR